MANKKQLTGGTGDVNPQYLSGRVTLSAADTTTTATLGTPIVRVGPQSNNRATIMEVLRVWSRFSTAPPAVAGQVAHTAQIMFSTTSFGTGTIELNEPRVFAGFTIEIANAFTAAGTGLLENNREPHVWDCTDGAGHGILIATDNIFIQASSALYTANILTVDFKILYRFKTVDLAEYIGIVQSQQ